MMFYSLCDSPRKEEPTPDDESRMRIRKKRESYGFVKEPSKPMSSVVPTGDGVDRTDVVVYPFPIISENRGRQCLRK